MGARPWPLVVPVSTPSPLPGRTPDRGRKVWSSGCWEEEEGEEEEGRLPRTFGP